MQALHGSFAVTSSRVTQPPRSASFCGSRSRLLRSPKPLGHAAQRLNGSVVNFSAATEAEPALPLVSDNAAAEVPHAEVASQDDLSAAIEKTESGPATTSDGQPQLKQQQQQQPSASAGPRGNGVGRPGGRASRRPRTIGPEQLVPGAQFEGNVVSVMAYGCFVDIGALTDGLVHISQLADEYVPDPNLVVQNGQTVKVRVQSWDPSKNRLSFTMKPENASADAGGGGGAGGYLDRQGDRQPRQGKVARAGASNPASFGLSACRSCCLLMHAVQKVLCDKPDMPVQ